ncbi:hypothetical protein [Amycolatopsis sp. WQ 127309]|uniref:hypothetical protein n=1 Tax=Amycolatopsis sp. WQ 127309 TaxID=2932773 RepID=UPI001FF40D2E|nr:hypothetical protein [Amycolatopsis sp. WQ 127309]UOZ02938.1 hypothetical protein MUY22_29230 [Amycolatopsis sp. WQ 127309]
MSAQSPAYRRARTPGHATGNHWEPITVETIYPAVIVSIDENVPSKQADGPRGCTVALAADNLTA